MLAYPTKKWDKKFKVRLTSKKTSKKLDSNVSYLIEGTYLSLNTQKPTDYMPDGIPTSPELDDPAIVLLYDTGWYCGTGTSPSVFGVSPFSVDSDTSIGALVMSLRILAVHLGRW